MRGRYCSAVAELVVGLDLPGSSLVRQLPLRPVYVGAGQNTAHVLEADPVFAQRRGVQVHADRGKGAAAHEDLADTLHLG